MSLDTLLSALAYKEGRAVRNALYRHRAIEEDPIFLVAWQNGFDPFAASAIAIGQAHAPPELFVMSDAREWEIEAPEYAAAAGRFCELFDAYAEATDTIEYRGRPLEVPVWLPQIIVANKATGQLLARMGRRLLRAQHSDPGLERLLRRFGSHLAWIARYAELPGQQILLPCTDFLNAHYQSPLSALERESLFALQAWIKPPPRMSGFDAAVRAERYSAGPSLKPEDAQRATQLYLHLEAGRKKGSESSPAVREALEALTAFYGALTQPVWELLIAIACREREVAPAAHLSRRIEQDRLAYALHFAGLARAMKSPGGIRITESARDAALRRDELERAAALLAVEEALDDPLKLLPQVITGEAVEGLVLTSEANEEEGATVVLRTEEACLVPCGMELWWTDSPHGAGWRLTRVEHEEKGSRLTFTHRFRKNPTGCPPARARAIFSALHFDDHLTRGISLPTQTPWTHRFAAEV